LGHEVDVVTVRQYAWDGALDLDLDTSGFRVHSVPFLHGQSTGVRNRETASAPGTAKRWEALRSATRRMRLAFGLFTDPANLAYRTMTRTARELVARERYDFVISTSPPEVAHFVARAVARTASLPWVADYRDLWLSQMRVHQLRLTDALSERVHRWILRDAALVTTVSMGLADTIRRHLGRDALVVYNGFYESLYSRPSRERRAECRLRIVYTGRLFERKRDPTVFFDALVELRRIAPIEAAKIEIRIYGHREPWLAKLIEARRLGDCVVLGGPISYANSLAAQRGADLLLFVDWMDESAEGVLTGKLFEYLGSGRPILCVGSREHTEASDLIRDCEAGVVVASQREIVASLRNFVATGSLPDIESARVSRYSRRHQAIALLDGVRVALGMWQGGGTCSTSGPGSRGRESSSSSGRENHTGRPWWPQR
jgi:glycosyltransferase involved in cell wall biosynthesis